jgi:lysophospholipase L1-like esterase
MTKKKPEQEPTSHISDGRTDSKNLAMKLITILILLIITEISLQLVIRIRDGEWLYQSLKGSRVPYVKLVEDSRIYTLKPGFSTKRGGIKINESGFRVVPCHVDIDKDKKGFIIVNSGDSIPFGVAVKNDKTYPYYLAKLFKKNGLSINVINAGIPSYNLRQSFDRLRLEVFPKYERSSIPVITMQQANDVFLLSYYREKWNPETTWADRRFIKKTSIWQNFATIYYGTLAIKKIFKTKEPKIKGPSQREKKASAYEGKRKKYDKYDATEMVKNARKILQKELSFYRDHSIYIVLMPIDPFYYQLSGLEKNNSLSKWHTIRDIVDAVDEMVFLYNNMLIEVSQEFENVFFFDTRPLMDAENREEMYVDHIHYSPKANKIVAKGLFDFLTQHQLLPEAAYQH